MSDRSNRTIYITGDVITLTMSEDGRVIAFSSLCCPAGRERMV
jgi:hypothetical protein